MQTTTDYASYLNSMKNYETPQGRKDYQAPFTEGFESIYNRAKKEDVTLSNAKEFLQSLSSNELKTLQKYSGLADNVNIDTLSAERVLTTYFCTIKSSTTLIVMASLKLA